MIAWFFRFIHNSRRTNTKFKGELTVDELNKAETFIFKQIQQQHFHDIDNKQISCLDPFLGEDGVIRLKSRVCNRKDTDGYRFPVVLPAKHPTVDGLIMDMHRRLCHVGTQGLLSQLRENYWILGGRRTIRSVLSKCGICRRFVSKPFVVEPPPLPFDRVRDAVAFEICGVDFAGPLFLRTGEKAWVCLFTCAVYRAVHMELTSSLSTKSFLQVLRRFVSRRGRPKIVYSDNGTNFRGTENAFATLDWDQITCETSIQRITWRFNPPTASWWGGFFERLIGVVKQLLRRVLGRACLSYEDLLTSLCDCEAVVNSRPLTYVSNDSKELISLTPAMFLHDLAEFGVPDCDEIDRISLSRSARHKQKLRDDLRKRFRLEYLGQLKFHFKGKTRELVKVGDVVLIGSDKAKRIEWPIGRVLEVFPGKDRLIRLVRVKTVRGDMMRPVQRLFSLEFHGDDSQIPKPDVSSDLEDTSSFTPPQKDVSRDLCDKNSAGVFKSRVPDKVKTTKSGRVSKMPRRYLETPCPDSPPEFREEQCTTFDNYPYEGGIYQWMPFYDDDEPCALTCKGKPEGADEDAVLVVVKLKDKVHDGTRCRLGSLDMCIDGRCQRVGCDLKIGSMKQVDECGVCGGDGSSCAKPLYHWTLTYASLCSTTCGGGYKMSRPICQNRVTGDEVEEELCNDSQRPDPTVVECNLHNCPPKWHAGEWGPCSVTCGGGSRLRQVHCVEETNNTKIRVDESKCSGYKPWFQEACNQMDCPTWFTTKWSGCSVSCGEGVQTRGVDCRDSRDQPSDLCESKSKPETTQACSTGIACPFHVDTSEELMPGLYHTQPLIQPYPPPPVPERLVGEQVVPSESTFIPDEWGPCSVTCGEGVRRREVYCKIFLEFSRTIAKLPDKQCSGEKPKEVEKCYREPCTAEKIGMDVKDDPSNIKVGSGSPAKSYSWKEQGFTHCSASCLGGVQELIVNCVRDDTQKVTSPFMCPIELKPEVIIRACNEHSCPPRWSYTEFSPCSQSCGIGIQTRDVSCIHELTQGGSNTVVVPNNRCPQPPPPDRQYCNVLDCPVRWRVAEWTKCSKTCGGGEKARKVECKQVMAQNHTVDRPVGMCPSPKPLEKKPCNTKSCIIESDKPHISVTNSTFIQHDPKKKKITVKVGGAATLFTGTTVKIKCPVKRFDRSKILWKKDNNFLPQNKKYKSSKKGALRVQSLSLRDMGTYTCVAGKSSASIAIAVRPKPGEFPTSEEIQKQYKTDLISGVNAAKAEGKPIYADDQSHEQRPDGTKKKHLKLFTPTSTSSSLTLDGYVLDSQTTEESGDNQKDKIPNLPSSSPELLNTRHHGDSTSSASRVMPNFLSLISKIQIPGFKPQASRGHRMVTFPGSQEQIVATDQAVPATSSDEVNEVVLGKGTKENLKFEWILSEWSKCSETCGGNGFQKRTAKCVVKLHNTTQGADNNLCEDAGISIPKINRKCGFDDCPQWTTSQWSGCEKSKCFALHKAFQKRIVKCQIGGNLTVDMNKCDPHQKPGQRQECYNEKCTGKWKAGSWSKCSAECEKRGEKYRILQCVWYGTKIPAGDACKNLLRPPTRKPCKGGPCNFSTEEECEDRSMFCANVKSLNMCKIARYQQQCCQTCKQHQED